MQMKDLKKTYISIVVNILRIPPNCDSGVGSNTIVDAVDRTERVDVDFQV